MADRNAQMDKLNNSNYMSWSFKMRMLLIKENCWNVVGGNADAGDEDGDEAEGLERRQEKALALICLMVDDDQLFLVRNANTGMDAWNALRDYHQRNTVANRIRAMKKLFKTEMPPGGSMQQHLQTMSDLIAELHEMGAPIADDVAVSAILASIGQEYEGLVVAMEAWDDERLTLNTVKAKLLDEWKRKSDRSEVDTAFVVTLGARQQPDFTCYFCQKKGHLKRDCILFKKYKEDKDNKESARTARMNKWYTNWCIDSGASSHMCHDESLFENFSADLSRSVTLANGNSIVAEGSGNIFLNIKPKSIDEKKVELHDVLLVPGLDEDLISVHKLTQKGLKVLFEEDDCYIIKGKDKWNVATYADGLYRVRLSTDVKLHAAVDKKGHCIHDWHKILAHRNLADIQAMGSKGLVIRKCNCDFLCEPCIKGKMSRKPFPKKGSEAVETLECIATDVCGPIQIESIGHSRYFMTFTDTYSGYCDVYFMKRKDECPSIVRRHIEKLKNHLNKKPKILRSDRGTEYLNKDLQTFLADEGIKFECTVGYAPEQNGTAERMNRTLMEPARTMLAEAGLPKCYWAEAVRHSCYVYNRLVNRKHKKTPLELMYGTKPDYNNIYQFGCDVYVMVPKEKRKKLDDKAVKRTYIGFDENSKGFRVTDPRTQRIVVTRDIVFLKNSPLKKDDSLTFNISEELNGISETEKFDSLEASLDEDDEFFDAEELPEPPRRSVRSNINQRPRYLEDYMLYSVTETNDLFEPRTYQEAITCKDKKEWMSAIQEEMTSIERNNTWELTDLPEGRKTIGSKWVFKIKTNEFGLPARYKARLVAQGFSQKYGVDYDEVFAPVVRSTTFRALMSVAGSRNYIVKHYDVKNAFLNSDLDEEIYLKPPPGFEGNDKVCKLRKSLYGLKQAARVWNQAIHGTLIECGCVQSQTDKCLYSIHKNKVNTYIIIHVDDILIAGNDLNLMNEIMDCVQRKFEIKDLGEVRNYLGNKVERSSDGSFSISQEKYIDEIVKAAHLTDAKESSCPIDIGYYKIEDSEPLEDNVDYQKMIGMLLYLTTNSRPDISAAVSILSQQISHPTRSDWNELKRVVRYIKGTRNLKLNLNSTAENKLYAYSDANWAEDRVDRKSNTGYIVYANGGVLSWCCRKQNIVTLSSCEAEYVALCETAKEIVWIKNLMKDFGQEMDDPIVIYTDSQSAMSMIEREKFSNRTKHVDIKYHYVKDLVQQGLIKLKYCSTEVNVADMLTKPLGRLKLTQLRNMAHLR